MKQVHCLINGGKPVPDEHVELANELEPELANELEELNNESRPKESATKQDSHQNSRDVGGVAE